MNADFYVYYLCLSAFIRGLIKKMTRQLAGLFDSMLALLALDLYDLAALVVAAVGAYLVGQAHLAAVGAGHGLAGLQCVMGAAAVSAALGMLAFWKRCHFS